MVNRILVVLFGVTLLLNLDSHVYAKKSKKGFRFFCRYVAGKVSEIPQMKLSLDLRLASIHRQVKKKHKVRSFQNIFINRIYYLHPITRSQTLDKLESRIASLKKANFESLKISYKEYNQYMPSITPIQVAKLGPKEFYVFDGNSRLVALRHLFSRQDLRRLKIEVEVFDLTGNEKLKKDIAKLRQKHGFI